MIRLSPSEQAVWDMFFVSVTVQVIRQADQRGPEYIAERAAEIADEMLLERRERCVERRSASVDRIRPD
ncbi:hypothetical protein GIR22_23230 [Pseudomonas sp. CCM 7891]|uniref:Uncharacterized protein n=1 Tax=Pseudomonas karstica TaxID=1055468 RepID=A0A7X2RXL8_9PSED|nr:hypothetical protein [Pseudomonas karstica]MTD22044.1 hypothetical protein [Pseudomonas karstica]